MDAFNWLKAMIASGRRARPSRCDVCTSIECVQHHSENYGAPYGDHIGQFQVCYVCHMIIHCRYSNPSAFVRHRQAVADGWKPKSLGFNFRAFSERFLNNPGLAHYDRRVDTGSIIDILDLVNTYRKWQPPINDNQA
jgi:hypothetical protein